MRVDAPRRMPWRMRVGVTTLLGALALFALANIQRARASQPTEPSVDFVVWDTEQTSWEGSNARRDERHLLPHLHTTCPTLLHLHLHLHLHFHLQPGGGAA